MGSISNGVADGSEQFGAEAESYTWQAGGHLGERMAFIVKTNTQAWLKQQRHMRLKSNSVRCGRGSAAFTKPM